MKSMLKVWEEKLLPQWRHWKRWIRPPLRVVKVPLFRYQRVPWGGG